MLLSDFDRWHAVLNRRSLPTTRADELRFERALREAGRRTNGPTPRGSRSA